MHKLDQECYQQVRGLFRELRTAHLNIDAVLDGTCSGHVYVDSPDRPVTACIQHGDAWYIAGSTANTAFNTALNALLPRDTYFVLFCEDGRWEAALEDILDGTYAKRAKRRHYVLRMPRLATLTDDIPEEYSLRRVDAAFLDEGLALRPVEDWIEEEWTSTQAFLELGFGACLLHGAQPVSWSLADYTHGKRCEMGIQTRWGYRQRGFGTLTAAAAAGQAFARGYEEIGWHCWDNNLGSVGVAENVGFALERTYDVYINHWVAENITDMSAEEFASFARDYEAWLVERPPETGYPHIVTATAWALAQDRAACFRQLNKAVDTGWLQSLEHLRTLWPELFLSPDLDDMPEWHALVRRLGPSP